MFFFFKQKTAYEMRISDWSSDVCSSDLAGVKACFDCKAQAARRTHARYIAFVFMEMASTNIGEMCDGGIEHGHIISRSPLLRAEYSRGATLAAYRVVDVNRDFEFDFEQARTDIIPRQTFEHGQGGRTSERLGG